MKNKKGFTIIELLFSIIIISSVILTIIHLNSNNNFLIKKYIKNEKNNDYITLINKKNIGNNNIFENLNNDFLLNNRLKIKINKKFKNLKIINKEESLIFDNGILKNIKIYKISLENNSSILNSIYRVNYD